MKKYSIKNIIVKAITAICIALCFYIAIEVIVSAKQGRPPRVFGVSISYVPTESMEPTIMTGDYVVFTKASFDNVKVNDIIVYKNEQNMFIIHRVIEKYSNYLICKGDNNALQDNLEITPDMVYGKYHHTIGFLKIFGGGISKNIVFGILIAIFSVAVVMQVVQLAIKSKAEETKKKAEDARKLALEQMKKEILAEELEKLKNGHYEADNDKEQS